MVNLKLAKMLKNALYRYVKESEKKILTSKTAVVMFTFCKTYYGAYFHTPEKLPF